MGGCALIGYAKRAGWRALHAIVYLYIQRITKNKKTNPMDSKERLELKVTFLAFPVLTFL
jgi:hypothetical protein